MTFTAASILADRKVLNCCSTMKSSEYIEKLKCGQKCDDLLETAKLMTNLTKVLEDFIPSGENVGGSQAYAVYTLSNSDVSQDGTLVLTIEGDTVVGYTFDFLADIAANVITDIIVYINDYNAAYPDDYPYTAQAHPTSLLKFVLVSYDYDGSNGIVCDLVITPTINPVITISNTLDNGVATHVRTEEENCLTNEEAEIILNKIKTLCSTPCEDIVNFE